MDDAQSELPIEEVLARKYHTLTPVVEPNGLSDGRELTRLMWVTPLAELDKSTSVVGGEQGMYLFGGFDHTGTQTADLYWISFDYKENAKVINTKTGDFKGALKPQVKLQAK